MAAGGRPRAQTSASRGRPAVGGLPPSRDLEVTLGMTTGNAWRTTAGGLEDTIVHCGRRGDGRSLTAGRRDFDADDLCCEPGAAVKESFTSM